MFEIDNLTPTHRFCPGLFAPLYWPPELTPSALGGSFHPTADQASACPNGRPWLCLRRPRPKIQPNSRSPLPADKHKRHSRRLDFVAQPLGQTGLFNQGCICWLRARVRLCQFHTSQRALRSNTPFRVRHCGHGTGTDSSRDETTRITFTLKVSALVWPTRNTTRLVLFG